jgi:hypothetical protein
MATKASNRASEVASKASVVVALQPSLVARVSV